MLLYVHFQRHPDIPQNGDCFKFFKLELTEKRAILAISTFLCYIWTDLLYVLQKSSWVPNSHASQGLIALKIFVMLLEWGQENSG